jgi:hypothetical protein
VLDGFVGLPLRVVYTNSCPHVGVVAEASPAQLEVENRTETGPSDLAA